MLITLGNAAVYKAVLIRVRALLFRIREITTLLGPLELLSTQGSLRALRNDIVVRVLPAMILFEPSL
jgi:hypothetical protein